MFLNAVFLPFLALAAVPIVLHLLTLHRVRTVELSTYRFLFDSYVQQRRRMRFLEALLAMLRALVVLGLVLLVSRPVVRHWAGLFGGGAGREVVLMVDASASMSATTAGVPAIDRAKGAALAVAGRLGKDDRVSLVRVAARPEEVFRRFGSEASALREKIEGLKVGPSRGNLFAALGQAFDPKARRGSAAPIVYLFTDGQATGWREVRDQGLAKVVPAGAKLIVVEVGSREPLDNRGVVGDAPRPHHAILGLPVTLRPRVVNHSKSESAEVVVGVILDEKEVARASLALKPGQAGVKEVVYVPGEPGEIRGRYELAPDRFPDDDRFLFTLSVAPPVKVLLVNGNPSTDPFQDEGLFLRTALSIGPGGADPSASTRGTPDTSKALDVQEVPEGGLNPDLLRDSAVVLLANCGSLNDQHFAWLRAYVSGGGGLIVLPGDKVNQDVYNQHFFTIAGGPVPVPAVAVTLGAPEGDPNQPQTFERLATLDYAHPVLSVFDDPDARYLTGARIYRRFPMTFPAEKRGAPAWPLAKFGKGTSALVEARLGDGTMLVAAFPADTRWTNLPLKPEFVPLILRLVGHARRGPELEVPSALLPGAAAEITVDGTWAPALGTVADPRGRPTPLEFGRSATRLTAEYAKAAEAGYYAVEVKGGKVEQPKAASAAFALNVAPEESDFAMAKAEQIRDWLPGADVTVVDASAEAQQAHGGLDDEREIWRPLIFLLFAVIGVEFLLSTSGGRRPDAEGDEFEAGDRARNPGQWFARATGAAEPAEEHA